MNALFASFALPADSWLALALDLTLKGTAILLAAFVAALLLRRASAARRHLAWSLALYSLLALPALTLVLPAWPVSLLPPLAAADAAGGNTSVKAAADVPASCELAPAGNHSAPYGAVAKIRAIV